MRYFLLLFCSTLAFCAFCTAHTGSGNGPHGHGNGPHGDGNGSHGHGKGSPSHGKGSHGQGNGPHDHVNGRHGHENGPHGHENKPHGHENKPHGHENKPHGHGKESHGHENKPHGHENKPHGDGKGSHDHGKGSHGHENKPHGHGKESHGHGKGSHGHENKPHGHGKESHGHENKPHGHGKESHGHENKPHGHGKESHGHENKPHGHGKESHGQGNGPHGHENGRHGHGNKGIVLTAPAGQIRGSFMTTRLGKKIYSFRGVRYAEAPVGQLRFKPPVAAAPWEGVFDASQEGPSCPRPYGINQSEDCLCLNVYSTKLPSNNQGDAANTKRPVIVYFHSGAFNNGSAQSYIHGPQYLLDQDIVLVTLNYRIGALGFLSTGDALAPGNLGLKDQVIALRWIQKNIASFGGDPNSVTIAGYSSGAWSVVLHMLSSMSKGLFHRGIVMSGSPVYQTRLPNHQKHYAVKQAELLGCPTDTSSKILECLRTKDAIEIAATLDEFYEWDTYPVFNWSPVVEPDVPGVERFLTGQPSDLIKQGKFSHVPLITGMTKDECGGEVVPIIEDARKGNTSVFRELNENWYKLAPIIFMYERDTVRSREISDTLKQHYFKDQPIGLNNVDNLANIYADAVSIFHGNNIAKLMAQYSTESVYHCKVSYQGRYSQVTWSDTQKPYGVVQHDDLFLYLFYGRFPLFDQNAPESLTVERMTTMWANFAKTGEPIPRDNSKFTGVTWTPLTLKSETYLDINNELVMGTNLYTERMAVWERLFPRQAASSVKRTCHCH